MPVTVTSRYLATDEQAGSSDQNDRRTYQEIFEVTQAEGETPAAGVAVAIAAQQVMSGDPLPLHGDTYARAGTTDLDAYAMKFAWKKPYPQQHPRRWHITCDYLPPDDVDPGQIGEPDPLLWPTEYWVEWTEEQVPLEKAKNVESLDHIGRGALIDGPIVNSAGEQTIDSQMKTFVYPVVCCQKAYSTLASIIALNSAYQESMNNGSFFGAPARYARYLGTESGRLQRAGGIGFYLGITRIWFKAALWDRRVLNNGMMHLQKNAAGTAYLRDGNAKLKLFRHMVREMHISDGKEGEPPAGTQVEGDLVPSPEPTNLDLLGQVLNKELAAINLTYRYLTELDYAGIGIGG